MIFFSLLFIGESTTLLTKYPDLLSFSIDQRVFIQKIVGEWRHAGHEIVNLIMLLFGTWFCVARGFMYNSELANLQPYLKRKQGQERGAGAEVRA